MTPRTRFDWVYNPALPKSEAAWDEPLLTSRSFVALPSLGSLVPGWVLIVPRRPMINLKGLTKNEITELGDIRARVHEHVGRFGRLFEFEHGANRKGSLVGCGVDQAHLHIVPLPFDLIQAAQNTDPEVVKWTQLSPNVDPWSHVSIMTEYVVIRAVGGSSLVGMVRVQQSQFVRRIISQNLPKQPDWNYRSHSGADNIAETIKALGVFA